MSKKHFNALAQALANVRPYDTANGRLATVIRSECHAGQVNQWQQCMHAIANVCSDHNTHFDWQRFVTACETWEAK